MALNENLDYTSGLYYKTFRIVMTVRSQSQYYKTTIVAKASHSQDYDHNHSFKVLALRSYCHYDRKTFIVQATAQWWGVSPHIKLKRYKRESCE